MIWLKSIELVLKTCWALSDLRENILHLEHMKMVFVLKLIPPQVSIKLPHNVVQPNSARRTSRCLEPSGGFKPLIHQLRHIVLNLPVLRLHTILMAISKALLSMFVLRLNNILHRLTQITVQLLVFLLLLGYDAP